MGRRRKCCCDGCEIFRTTFQSSSDLSSNWTSSSGSHPTYNATSGHAEIGTSGVRVIANSTHSTSPYNMVVSVTAKGPTNSELRALVSWNGTSGLVAELRPGTACGTLELFEVQSGVETSLNTLLIPGATINEMHTIRACYDDDTGIFTAHVITSDNAVHYASGSPASHTAASGAGFGTGPTHSGTASFGVFGFWDLGQPEADPPTPCEDCTPPNCAWAIGHFDDTAYSCEWDDDGGTWTIDDTNEWIETSETSSVILHKSPNWIDPTVMKLQLRFYAANDDRVIRAIISAADADNYTAVEVKVGYGTDDNCAVMKVIDRSGGFESDISQEFIVQDVPSDAWYWLTVELRPETTFNTVHACLHELQPVDFAPGDIRIQISSYLDYAFNHGDQVGFATAGGSGDVRLSYFVAGCARFSKYCILQEDDFSNWPSSGVQCNWSVVSGTGMSQTGFTATGHMQNEYPVPGNGISQHAAELDFVPIIDGDKIGVTAGGDGNSYYMAEVEATILNPKFRLIKCNAGSKSTLATFSDPIVAPLSGQGRLRICMLPGGVVIANYTDAYGGEAYLYDGGEFAYGAYCGIDATPAGSHVVANAFRTYRVGTYNADWPAAVQTCQSCELPCDACEDQVQSAWLVSTSTVEDGNCDCSDLRGTFYVDQPSSGFSSTCQIEAEYLLIGDINCHQCLISPGTHTYEYSLTGRVVWSVKPIYNPTGNNYIEVTLAFTVRAQDTEPGYTSDWDEWDVTWTFQADLGPSGGDRIDCESINNVPCYLVGHATGVARSTGTVPGTGNNPANVYQCDAGPWHLICGIKGDLISGSAYYLDTAAVVYVSSA